MNKEDLKNKIIEANKQYRLGNTIMDDIAYDELVEQFQSMVSESEYNEFRNTLNEGDIEQGTKIKHKYICGSLDKLKNEEPETIIKFLKKSISKSLNISAKIDGLSGIAKYVNGKLVQFATRGDGYEGCDITNKAKYVKFLPSEIKCKDEIYIRGELVILKSDYDKIEGTSPRNIVAGLVNRKEFNPNEIKNVSFVCYTIMGDEYTKKEQFKFLEDNGFNVSWHKDIESSNINYDTIVDEFFGYATQGYDYATDGLVISDSSYTNEERYRPINCVAYKTNQQSFETRLIDVEWQGPSKNGRFNCLGILEPCDCGGVLVSKCTLHNIDFMKQHNIKVGDYVKIIRSGDVIPKFISVTKTTDESTDITYPTHCSCCGSELIKDGPFLYCPNENCKDRTTYQVESFIKNMKVDNVSFKQLQNFGIYNFQTLLKFNANPKYKSETKFMDELKNKVFNRSKTDIFCSITMKDLAEKTLKTIIDFYGWDKIESNEIDADTLSNLPIGIGDITMNKFLSYYKNNLKILNMIIADARYCYVKGNETVVKTKKNGLSICFTGKLETMGRTEAGKLAESNGYEVKNSVTKGLTYLCTNDTTTNTSKNKKARELGTKIITEAEFLELMNGKSMNPDEL